MAERQGEAFLPNAPGDLDFKAYTQQLFKSLVRATVASNALPVGDDHDFYNSYPQVSQDLAARRTHLLSTIQSLLRLPQLERCNRIQLSAHGGHGEDEVEERFDQLVEGVDSLLERMDTIIDNDIVGAPRSDAAHQMHTQAAAHMTARATAPQGQGQGYAMVHAKNIIRPQLKWDASCKVDNSNAPFVPLITHKPNALVPLEDVYRKHGHGLQQPPSAEQLDVAIATHVRDSLGIQSHPQPAEDSYPHPYGPELDAFAPSGWMLDDPEPQLYRPLDETPFTYIDTVAGLRELSQTLTSVREIAIDTEAHAYRSFSGFVCLMQISTRDEDYVVDTLALRAHMHMLNAALTDPAIVKVLHGADMDIVWLQRDFGLYVVNMFDTGQAARVLEFPRFSLAYLLDHYCGVTADKKYQLADWRIRPIPGEMLKYAREDTHYLLYIADRLRAELVARGNANKNFLHAAWNRSTEVCRRRFEKERWTPGSYLELYHKYSRAYNATQLRVFKALYDWRDGLARHEDESPRYVLPNHMMFQIARLTPADADGVLACCNPIPPLVRLHANDLAALIQAALTAPDDDLPIEMHAAPATAPALADAVVAGQAGARLAATHHLYNPAGWADDEAQPAVSLEERLRRCAPLRAGRPSGMATLLGAGATDADAPGRRRAARIAQSFMDLFAAFSASAAKMAARAPPPVATEPEAAAQKQNAAAAAAEVEKRAKSPEVITLSHMKKSQSQLGKGKRAPPAPDADMGDGDGGGQADAKPAKKPRIEQEKPARAAAGLGDDFVPFDYSAASVPSHEATRAEAGGRDPKGKGKGKKGRQPAAFDPHASIQELKFKKEPRTNTAPKTGQRSMTYSYKK